MKTKTFTSQTGSAAEFSDYELQSTLRDFLQEEEEEKSTIWNVATIAGLAMFFVSMLYILQLVGLFSGLTGWINTLPVLGAVLIVFVGFGFLVGDRKRVKRILNKQRQKRKEYFETEFGSQQKSDEDFNLKNDLFDKSETSKEKNPFNASKFDRYALGHSKKLYKSRTNKKIAGVCGGLSRYFGISANIIRFLFVIATIAGIGASVIIYIVLAIILDKEPPELMAVDDLNY